MLSEPFLDCISLFPFKDGQDSISPGCRVWAAGGGGVPSSTGLFSQCQRQGMGIKPHVKEVNSKDYRM